MVQLVTFGFGIPGNRGKQRTDSIRSPLYPMPQNIAKAKELLAQAGYPDGIKVDLKTAASDLLPGMLAMVQAYKEMAAPAGITVNILMSPNASFWDDVYRSSPLSPPIGTPAIQFPRCRSPVEQCEIQRAHWNRADFGKLLDDAASI